MLALPPVIRLGAHVAVSDLDLVPVPRVNAETPLFDLLNLFKLGRSTLLSLLSLIPHISLFLSPD